MGGLTHRSGVKGIIKKINNLECEEKRKMLFVVVFFSFLLLLENWGTKSASSYGRGGGYNSDFTRIRVRSF